MVLCEVAKKLPMIKGKAGFTPKDEVAGDKFIVGGQSSSGAPG